MSDEAVRSWEWLSRNEEPSRCDKSYRHPEVRAIFGAPRRMLFSTVLAAILRDAAKTPLLTD
jgi:hypothetical protein